MLAAGANVNATSDEDEMTALMHAAGMGYAPVVRALLAADGIDVNAGVLASHAPGSTALMMAAGEGQSEAVEALLAAPDIDVNATNDLLSTALMYAVGYGQVETVEMLLAVPGLEINAANNQGGTALMIAASTTHADSARVLRAMLATPAVEVNLRDEDGCGALIFASSAGHVDNVRALLAARADVNATDEDGWTALCFAASEGHHEVVSSLLAAPAVDVTVADEEGGWTALALGAREGHVETVRALLARPSTDADPVTSLGLTPLALALLRGDAEVAAALRAGGASRDTFAVAAPATGCMITWCTVGCPTATVTRGRVMFELALSKVGNAPQCGWASPAGFVPIADTVVQSEAAKGVGDDAFSWAADGKRSLLWHDGSMPWRSREGDPMRWSDGDVIGCAVDLDAGTVWLGHNGEWCVAFDGVPRESWAHGLYPAWTGKYMAFKINEPPRFPFPGPGFRALSLPAPRLLDGEQQGALFVDASSRET